MVASIEIVTPGANSYSSVAARMPSGHEGHEGNELPGCPPPCSTYLDRAVHIV